MDAILVPVPTELQQFGNAMVTLNGREMGMRDARWMITQSSFKEDSYSGVKTVKGGKRGETRREGRRYRLNSCK